MIVNIESELIEPFEFLSFKTTKIHDDIMVKNKS
jgi:hypothetical protein